LASGIVAAFYPTIFSAGRRLQTDPGDTLLNHYILEHSWRCLTDAAYRGTLWSPPFFYPTPDVLAYSENLFGTAPVYWLCRVICDEIRAYQLWMIGVTSLTYLSMAWVLSRWQVNTALSALAAFVFAFGLPRVSQLSHHQLLPAMFSPWAVYYLVEFLLRPNRRYLALGLIFTFWQLLASIYLGWFLMLGMTIYGCAFVVMRRIAGDEDIESPRLLPFFTIYWRSSVLMILLFSLAVTWLVLPYVSVNQGFHRSYSEVRMMLPAPRSWVSPPPASVWANYLPSATGPASHEHHLFPGMVLFVLTAMIAAIHRTQPARLSAVAGAAFATASILILISLQIDKISAWKFVYRHVPGAQGIRAVARIFTVVYLFWWIGVALSLRTWSFENMRLGKLTWTALLVVGVLEHWQPKLPSFDPRPFFAETERLAQEMRGSTAVFVEPDAGAARWVNELSAMWAGLQANVPVVNGYSGRWPRGYPQAITGPDQLAKWLGPCHNVNVIGPARLAHAYPMPIEQLRSPQYLQALRGI
jgi:hypothetical protein